MKKINFLAVLFLMFGGSVLLSGCQKAYYGTMEALGHPKRELLVKRVAGARDSQAEAKEQFESALEQFSSVLNFSGGELEEKYKQLNAEFERSETKAKKVKKRIGDVENVAEALFDEWAAELEEYSSDKLRRASERKLEQTRKRYTQLINAMHRAEEKTGPVLSAFRDQVLFLKHNLNARAIASLHDELANVEAEIGSLIKEMEVSIAEADKFISAMTAE